MLECEEVPMVEAVAEVLRVPRSSMNEPAQQHARMPCQMPGRQWRFSAGAIEDCPTGGMAHPVAARAGHGQRMAGSSRKEEST